MEIFLQWWGGIAYFLAKVFLVSADIAKKNNKIRLVGWLAFLIGLPTWVIFQAMNKNWMASAMEIASIPSILLGIIMAWKRYVNLNKIVDRSILIFTLFMIIVGIFYSVYTFNGIKTFSQLLEIVIIFCYLLSIYLLAKRNPFSWLMLIIGHVSMSYLMFIQKNYILWIQQIVSIIPAIIGLMNNMKEAKSKNISMPK